MNILTDVLVVVIAALTAFIGILLHRKIFPVLSYVRKYST